MWYRHGVTHSHILASQVSEGGTLGGAIRFPLNRICIIEVWSEQETLDDRCNRWVLHNYIVNYLSEKPKYF